MMEVEMKNFEEIFKKINPPKIEKIGVESIKIYEFYEYELADFTKKVANVCIQLCQENALSGQGKNSCQHDIDSIKKYFNLDDE